MMATLAPTHKDFLCVLMNEMARRFSSFHVAVSLVVSVIQDWRVQVQYAVTPTTKTRARSNPAFDAVAGHDESALVSAIFFGGHEGRLEAAVHPVLHLLHEHGGFTRLRVSTPPRDHRQLPGVGGAGPKR